MDIEAAFVHVGSFGKSQLLSTALGFIGNIVFGSQMTLMVIVGATPDMSVKSEQNLSTIVTEWNLYNEQWIVDLMASLFMAGFIVGCLTLAQLADLYGRKPIVLTCIFLFAVCGLSSAFCKCWQTFAVTRFLAGFFAGSTSSAFFSWVCELVGKEKWGIIGMGFQVMFSIGIMLLSGVAYASKDWRTVCIVVSCIPFAILPIYFFVVPESPRWLYSVGKLERAEEIMKYMARMNGRDGSVIKLTDASTNTNDESSGTLHKYSIIDLFKVKKFAIRVMLFCVLWFSASIVYYGFTLDASALVPNIYLGLVLSGLVELPSYVITIILMEWKRTGRKGANFLLMAAAGVACAGIIFTGSRTDTSSTTARTVFSLIAKLCAAGSFSLLYVYNSEAFPTALRVVSISLPNIFARVGAIIAPFVPLLGSSSQMYLPYVVFGVASIAGATANLGLPDTLNKPVPEMPAVLKRETVTNVNSNDSDDDENPLIENE